MRKIIIPLLFVLSLFTYSCGGGGGAGSADLPPGESPGTAFTVQLLPSNYVAQTNTSITFYAKVLDGNGVPVKDVDVSFTNLSLIGKLDPPSAKTDESGLARTTLSSTTPGFSTILAEINTGVGAVRSKRTVFFSEESLQWPSPYLTLDVDGDNDGNYNEDSDLTLFQTSNDNQVLVKATVFNEYGEKVSNITVTFGSDSKEVTFPLGETATTVNGEASVLIQVDPSVLRSLTTTINITAEADNGAYNMVTLFLNPVTISITVTASPTKVESDNESNVIATLTTSTGMPAPDETTVNFTASCGQMDPPFAQTTSGSASSKFKAPSTTKDINCVVIAKAGGKTDSVVIEVVGVPGPLTIIPDELTVKEGDTAYFFIHNGTKPYFVDVDHDKRTNIKIGTFSTGSCTPASTAFPYVVDQDPTVVFCVTDNNLCPAGSDNIIPVTISVWDPTGSKVKATYNVDCDP